MEGSESEEEGEGEEEEVEMEVQATGDCESALKQRGGFDLDLDFGGEEVVVGKEVAELDRGVMVGFSGRGMV